MRFIMKEQLKSPIEGCLSESGCNPSPEQLDETMLERRILHLVKVPWSDTRVHIRPPVPNRTTQTIFFCF